MIQRIQTVFLFLAAAAAFGTFALPFATVNETLSSSIFADGRFNVQDHIGLIILFAIAGVLAIVAIFLYKNRLQQMRLVLVVVVVTIAGVALGSVLLAQTIVPAARVGIGAFLPLVTLVFGMLAHRAIKKDEKLVKSMDRLR